MFRTRKHSVIAITAGLFLSCTSASAQQQVVWEEPTGGTVQVNSKNDILSSGMKSWGDPLSAADSLRLEQVRAAAASFGSQAGASMRARQIQDALRLRAAEYDRAFNFSKIMLEPGFLPPVISEGRDAYSQPSDFEARASDMIFRIERPARIVSAAPTWRVYLLSDTQQTQRPDQSLMPKTSSEKKEWDRWASDGWDQGIILANQNFEASLARLRRDFEGMVRFKVLYEQGLVSKPVLSRSALGNTGGGDEMAVNDRIIRVTAAASLDPNRRNWKSPVPATAATDKQ